MVDGTVTFVFTDIEASTRLLVEHPGHYPSIVARQRKIIVDEAAREGGEFIGHEGDSCFLVFADATSAARAAAEAQRLLIAEQWPVGVAVRVRFGLHTGEAERSGADWFGLAVHTAARVASAAHGGQILLSEATRAMGLPPALEARDLGLHRLKDLDDAIRLFQLAGPGLAHEFPPPRASPSGGTLRSPATSFIGREREIEEVATHLEGSRLVTLLGPGGIGKTRLAVEVGRRLGPDLRDGAWFADLTTTTDPAAVAEVIAEAVGVSVRGRGDAVSAVSDVLHRAEGLLIVDNLEHVMAAVPAVARLLQSTDALRVLVTSRERLRVDGEQVYEVRPLAIHPDGPAVRLFVERARAVDPSFSEDPAGVDAIVRICRRLDGLPLAIELAAARTRIFQPGEIARLLEAGGIGLAGGPRDAHSRHQTIRDAIEWSHQLLSDDERRLFAGLAAFASPPRYEAIEGVLGAPGLDEALAGLVDKSLVQVRTTDGEDSRFGTLELVRELAAEKLVDRPDADLLASRHAEYYIDWVERQSRAMLTVEPESAMRRVEVELGDVTRVMEWTLRHQAVDAVRLFGALGFFVHRTGITHTARQWHARLAGIEAPDEVEVRRAMTAGYIWFGFRDLPAARAEWERAVALARGTADLLMEAWATMSMGGTYIGEPTDHARGVDYAERGILLAERAGAPALVAQGHNIVGELGRVHGDDAAAEAAYLAGLRVARSIDDHHREAILLGNLVYIATHRGELDAAIELATRAIAIHRRHGHRNQLCWVSVALSGTLALAGESRPAAILLAAADEAARRMRFEEMPGDVAENIRIRTVVRERAGSQYDEWSERGRGMTIEEAIDLALHRLDARLRP